jgi:hypothetical protein
MTKARLAWLEPRLRAAADRGVRIYIVTKTREEHGPEYRLLEEALSTWGAVVVHKRHMHEKLVFVDDHILWAGSLNPLSFRDTQEVMIRWASRRVVQEFASTLRLHDLIREYDSGQPACPFCGSEVVASEGRNDPFFWRCVMDDCYTRSIDQPPAKDGIVVCANCGGRVRYGKWGGKPVWRCIENSRHRQRIVRTHLRLPEMRSEIPKRELKKLEKLFSVSSTRSSPRAESGQNELDFDPGSDEKGRF